MPDLNVTIDARGALRAVIRSRYDRSIQDADWSATTPSDDPPSGLGSQDTTDWQITLDRSSKRMIDQGYAMKDISPAETEGARKSNLTASVSLLVSKASGGPSLRIEPHHLLLGVGTGLMAGAIVTLGVAYRSSKKRGK